MKGQINPKILGASVLGLALVAGSYTVSNFGQSNRVYQAANVQSAVATQRVAIEVRDKVEEKASKVKNISKEKLESIMNIIESPPLNNLGINANFVTREDIIRYAKLIKKYI